MKRLAILFLSVTCLLTLASLAAPRARASGSSPTAGTIATSAASLNVRSGPSASYAVVATLPRGAVVTLYGQSGGWWRVGLSGGKSGYCSASYIKEISGSTAKTVAANREAAIFFAGGKRRAPAIKNPHC